jgi:hypothetical protein
MNRREVVKNISVLLAEYKNNPNLREKINEEFAKVEEIDNEELDMLFLDFERMARNHRKQVIVVRNIVGINSFIYFNNLNGNKLLLMGEHHNTKNICNTDYYEIHKYLYDIAVNEKECLDIFIEESFLRHRNNWRSAKMIRDMPLTEFKSPLRAIRDMFEGCNVKNNKKCFAENVRYHLIDIREIEYIGYGPISHLFQKNVLLDNIDIDDKDILLKYYMGWDKSKESENTFLHYLYLIIGDNTLENKLIDYMSSYHKLINKTLSKITHINRNVFFSTLFLVYKEDLINNFDEYSGDNFFNNLLTVQMDVYFLLRYLHKYDESKMSRGPRNCPNYHKKSILYAGANHIINISRFFTLYYETLPDIKIINNSVMNNCIELNEDFTF